MKKSQAPSVFMHGRGIATNPRPFLERFELEVEGTSEKAAIRFHADHSRSVIAYNRYVRERPL